MKLVQILLPVYSPEGRRFPQTLIRSTALALAQRFGGSTAYLRTPALGLWRTRARTVRDDVIVIEVMVRQFSRRTWRPIQKQLESDFRQEMVVVRSMTVDQL
jgi:hypothetical protein